MDILTAASVCALFAAGPHPCVAPAQVSTPAIAQWQSLIADAAHRFEIPEGWIRGVMRLESGGHTMLDGAPITSLAGAMGLMQLMPGTYADMRARYGLGADPYDPHDNIFAGTAYMHEMFAPLGSKIIGSYDSVVAFGQSRALVVWKRIIMPNGSSIQIDNLPATDTEGYAGLEDGVDYHTWRLLKGVALSTLLGMGTQLSVNNDNNDLLSALRDSAQNSANQAGQQLTQKNMDIQPTLTVRPGWPLRVIVSRDIILRPYQS